MWFLFAVLAALINATTRLSNQYLKLSGHSLTVLIKSLQILYFLPFLFFVEWPNSALFYVIACLTGPLVLLQDRAFFNFTAKHGAGAIARVEPLSIPLVFILWMVIQPSAFYDLLDTPLNFIGIILAIAACVCFAFRMRQCTLSFDILKSMIPLIFIMGSISLLAKSGIDQAPNIEGIVVYGFIQSLVLVALSPLLTKKENDTPVNILNKKYLIPAFFLSLLMMGVIICRLYGFILTPNPAYVTAVMLTGPFWIMIFYKMTGHKEDGDILSGLGIVISVIFLTLVVSL